LEPCADVSGLDVLSGCRDEGDVLLFGEVVIDGPVGIVELVGEVAEILGDAGIYFSPFYPADLYRALKLVLADRDTYAMKSSQRYEQICKRQRSDLDKLIQAIIL